MQGRPATGSARPVAPRCRAGTPPGLDHPPRRVVPEQDQGPHHGVTSIGCQWRFSTSVGAPGHRWSSSASTSKPGRGCRSGSRTRRLEIHNLTCFPYTTDTIDQRKGRGSNRQGSALARFPSGSRHRSGGPSGTTRHSFLFNRHFQWSRWGLTHRSFPRRGNVFATRRRDRSVRFFSFPKPAPRPGLEPGTPR